MIEEVIEYNVGVISRILDLTLIGMCLVIMMIIFMFYFYIGSKTPLHMNMMIVLNIGCKPIVDDIYVHISWFCWVWTPKHMIDEMFCVGRGP